MHCEQLVNPSNYSCLIATKLQLTKFYKKIII